LAGHGGTRRPSKFRQQIVITFFDQTFGRLGVITDFRLSGQRQFDFSIKQLAFLKYIRRFANKSLSKIFRHDQFIFRRLKPTTYQGPPLKPMPAPLPQGIKNQTLMPSKRLAGFINNLSRLRLEILL